METVIYNVPRFYGNRLPKTNEVVMARVERFSEVGVYVRLLEYGNIEGFINIREVSRRKIRSLHREVKKGQELGLLVIAVDEVKGYVDLSKRSLYENEDISVDKYRYSSKINRLGLDVYKTYLSFIGKSHNEKLLEKVLGVKVPIATCIKY